MSTYITISGNTTYYLKKVNFSDEVILHVFVSLTIIIRNVKSCLLKVFMVLHKVQEMYSPKVNIWCVSYIAEVIGLMIDQSCEL